MVMLRNKFVCLLWKWYAPEQKFRVENGGLSRGTYAIHDMGIGYQVTFVLQETPFPLLALLLSRVTVQKWHIDIQTLHQNCSFSVCATNRALARISDLGVQKCTFGVNWVSELLFSPLHYKYTKNMDIRVSKISNIGCPISATYRVSKRHQDTPLAKGLASTNNSN